MHLLLFAACGDDAEDALEEFEQACEDYCEGVKAADCEDEIIPVDNCGAACAVFAEQVGTCTQEFADAYGCAAEGGFECVNGRAFPKSACYGELTAQLECMQAAPCKDFCREATEGGCAGGSEEACVSKCEADLASYEETSSCDYRYEDVLECFGEGGLVCNGDQPGAGSCGYEVLDMGDCLANDNVCEGFCFAADLMGCGAGCAADCETKQAATCASEHRNLLECHLRDSQAMCTAGSLVGGNCDYDQEQYDDCLTGN